MCCPKNNLIKIWLLILLLLNLQSQFLHIRSKQVLLITNYHLFLWFGLK